VTTNSSSATNDIADSWVNRFGFRRVSVLRALMGLDNVPAQNGGIFAQGETEMTIFRSAVNLRHSIPDIDPRAGQILFAWFTSSGWLDQAPLVALRIEQDLKGPGSVALDAAYPLGTKGLGLSGGCSDV
jgi:hypothetical protein